MQKFLKIMIVGNPGSGKTTIARQLHKITNIPVHHLDRLMFKSGWIKIEFEEFLQMQKQLIQQSSWIIEGCSTKTFEIRYAKADICIYLCPSRWTCLKRIFLRSFAQRFGDIPEGCPEHINFTFLSYIWNFEKKVDPIITHLREKYPRVVFQKLKTSNEITSFLNNF